MSQIKKGAILSYVNIILNIAVGLLLTPYIIRKLGDSEYGLYALIGSFVAYLSLMDLGLNNTVVRFVSKFRAEKDLEGERRFLGTTLLIYFAISFVLVVIGLIMYLNIEKIFGQSLTLEQMGKAKVMFLILVFNLSITLPGNTFTAICNAYERFVFPRFVTILRYILRALAVFTILNIGGKAIALVIIDTFFNLTIIFTTFFYTHSTLRIQYNFTERNKSIIKQIFSYSFWIFVLGIISQFQWNIGQVILGIKVNTTEVAIYSVGIMLGGYYGAFSSAISGLFLPRASQMIINNTNEQLNEMMIRIGRISFAPLLLVLSAFILFGKKFVLLWVGPKYEDSYWIAMFVMIAYTIPLLQTFANSIIMAKNLVAYKVKVYCISLAAGIIIGYFLITKYGGVGMICGITIGWLFAQAIMNIFFYRVLKLDINSFFKMLLKGFLVPTIFCLVLGYIISIIPGEYWINFVIQCILYSLIYVFLIWKWALNSYEKQLFKNLWPG